MLHANSTRAQLWLSFSIWARLISERARLMKEPPPKPCPRRTGHTIAPASFPLRAKRAPNFCNTQRALTVSSRPDGSVEDDEDEDDEDEDERFGDGAE
ncbi:hypothetical protein AOLI_G00083010 [Acnodon oligacanthus]